MLSTSRPIRSVSRRCRASTKTPEPTLTTMRPARASDRRTGRPLFVFMSGAYLPGLLLSNQIESR